MSLPLRRKFNWLSIAGAAVLGGAPAISPAITPEEQGVMQEIGAVLAWRLGPEAIRDRCAQVNPDGVGAHRKAVDEWLEKNAKLIATVDERVVEVLPLIRRKANGADAIRETRAAVASMLVESVFAKRSAEEARGICARESDPANPRLAKSGLRLVNQSLAAMYDWKFTRESEGK